MANLYEATNKATRAAAHRAAAEECERAGFLGFAAYNRAMADSLEPPPRIPWRERNRPEIAPGAKPRAPRQLGADPSRVGGRRDAPPLRVNRA